MAGVHHALAFAAGLLGNIISFLVYLAPVPTFYRICKRRSTEGFQAVPYVVALYSAMLMIYYALVKTNSLLLLTINGIGCFIETVYIVLFLIFAPRKVRISTLKLLMLLNVVSYSVIVCLTFLLLKGPTRVHVVGWINVCFSVSVFAAPLSIMRLVVRTKSVEFMPFTLSFFLTVSAVAWFSYGMLIKDVYVAAPNILGFLFGVAQMVLYMIYRNAKPPGNHYNDPEGGSTPQDGKHQERPIKRSSTMTSGVHPIDEMRVEEGEAEKQRSTCGTDHVAEMSVTIGGGEVELNLPRA